MKSGIYRIKNIINNKVYIGSTIEFKKRWRDHKWYLNQNIHQNSHLQCSWNKYGISSFEFLILLECKKEELLINERKYILEYNAFNRDLGYNVNDPEFGFLNRKHSDETKAKLSKQMLGNKNPMYGKFGENHPNYHKVVSEETRKKISLSRVGVPTNNRNGQKLNESDIPIIRKLYYEEKISQPKIANLYLVSYATINGIIKGRLWKNVV